MFCLQSKVHSAQIFIYSLYLFEAKLTGCVCYFAETLGAAQCICSCLMPDSEELRVEALGCLRLRLFLSAYPLELYGISLQQMQQ